VTEPTFGPDERDALRVLVRQVLRDALPEGVDPVADPQQPDAPRADGAAESVVLRSDADLQRFVGRLLTLFENPKRRSDLQTGRLRFTLATSSVAGQPVPVRRVDRGAVTETQVKDAARVGASILLGRRAVLTPLARDRARALGVNVEKES
jgi:hypothetical protein